MDVRFYHLITLSEDKALCLLAAKALDQNLRLYIFTPQGACESRQEALYTLVQNSFLPSSLAHQDSAEMLEAAPILLGQTPQERSNGASLLFVTGDCFFKVDDVQAWGYDKLFFLFSKQNPAQEEKARSAWKTIKEAAGSLDLSYWRQTPQGWENVS